MNDHPSRREFLKTVIFAGACCGLPGVLGATNWNIGIFAWFKLLILEQRLGFQFGKYNKYRSLCLKRNAKSAVEKLLIAQEVWDGPGVNTLEARARDIFLQKHGIKP
jgi:hypothetical protein